MKKITFLLLMLGFTSFISAQCLDASFGQYPFAAYTPVTCDGVTVNVIRTNCYAGEYSAVNVVEGQTYVFGGSVATDYLTISADEGASAVAFGEGSVTWVSDFTGEVWFFTHTDDACGEEEEDRSRTVICGTVSADAPDYVSLQWPPTANFTEGGSVDVYGQVYEGGLTDVAPNVDGQAPGIQMWVGISPEGENTNPSTWTTWIESTFNAGHISNNDEYMATIGSDLDAGTYYYATRFRLNDGVFVYGGINASNNGNFWNGTEFNSGVMTIDPLQAPANDACSGAIAIAEFPYTFEQTDGSASTNNDGFITACTSGMNDGLWYSFVGNGNDITIAIEPADDFDPRLGVFSGNCGALVCEATVDDGGNGGDEEITIDASEIGVTYYVNVGYYSATTDNDEGNFTIEVTSEVPPTAPANDACSGAIAITELPYTFEQTDGAGATNNDGFITGCTDAMNDGVWYTVVGDGTNLTISITPDDTFDPQIGVYTGSCGTFTCVGTADGGFVAGAPETYVIVASEVGTTYFINVGDWSGVTDNDEGSFTINVISTAVEPLPECAMNPTPMDGAVDVPVGDVVFTWEASATGGVATSYDFYGGVTTPLSEDDFIGNYTTTSADITINGFDLLLYWKVVPRNLTGEALGCVEWSFTTVSAPPAPANDACTNATVITTPYEFEQADGAGATNNDGNDTVCTDPMNDGVWYTVAGDGGDITFTITPDANYDPQVNYYSGACGAFTCLGTADAGLEGDEETFTITESVIGTNYYVNIGHWNNATDAPEGNFSIEVTSTVLSTPSFDASNFKVFPNPVNNVLNLSYTQNMTNVEIFNVLGQRVISKAINANTSEIDMSSLTAGTYLVKVASETEFTTVKVIKQ